MKQLVYLILCTLCFVSCSNDDDNQTTNSNLLKVGSNEFTIETAVLITNQSDQHDDSYNIILLSKKLKVEKYGVLNNNTMDYSLVYSGTGQYINCLLYSTGNNQLAPGEYILDTKTYPDDAPSGILRESTYCTSWTEAVSQEDQELVNENTFPAVSGSVIVKKNNEKYEITIDFIDENGTNVKGYYNGILLNYN